MNKSSFETVTHAKCILAGEHAVLRGHHALVFPIKSKFLKFSYHDNHKPLKLNFDSRYAENLSIIFWGTIQSSLKLLDKTNEKLLGEFSITNNIPMGSGMGFSSAICVVIAQWVAWKKWLHQDELFNFARKLEDDFHGKSSGIDIAGVLADKGILFSIVEGIKDINLSWKPKLYISSSEQTSSTAKCIKQVEKIWKHDEKLAEQIDKLMEKSVLLAKDALSMNEKQGLMHLAEAINHARECFNQWGLIDNKLQAQIDSLFAHGAIAVKPTGSGAGGYILSLWKEKPAIETIPCKLIPVL